MKDLFDNATTVPLFKLWLVFFAYTAFVALLVQLILLPYVFTSWHAGGGLLKSALDSGGFHQLAVELSQKINQQGWHMWELTPSDHAPSGIAAIIYALTVPKLWTLIPLNAVLHATAAVLLVLIIQTLIEDQKKALCSVIPFVFYPTATIWYAQLHRDGYIIVGFYMIFYGWLLLLKSKEEICWWTYLKPVLFIITGLILIFIMRRYLVDLTRILSIISAFIITGMLFLALLKNKSKIRGIAIKLVIAWIIPFALYPMTVTAMGKIFDQKINVVSEMVTSRKVEKIHYRMSFLEVKDKLKVKNNKNKLINYMLEIGVRLINYINEKVIDLYNLLATPILSRVYILLDTREGFRMGGGYSILDKDVKLTDFSDLIYYMPRCLQIAFLSPFPYQWFESGSLQSATVQRRIVGIEMVGIYFALLFLPYSIWHWRKKVELWLMLIFSLIHIIFFALLVMNVGTLHRMRYGYLMMIVAVGIAGFIKAWERLHYLRTKNKTL